MNPRETTTPGQAPDLSLSSVFRLRDIDHYEAIVRGEEPGFFYARDGHPNAERLNNELAALEGAEAGLVTPSGMAAIAALLFHKLRPGSRLVLDRQLYGKTLTLADKNLRAWGAEVVIADLRDQATAESAITKGTDVVWVESLSNPLLRWSRIDELAKLARREGALLVVDNTFTPPPVLQPLRLGADIVMHSLTKIISGHSDVTLGCLLGAKALIDEVRASASTMGYHASAMDCWLTERSLPSLDLRVRAACENARQLADYLPSLTGVGRIHYPTRSDHPDCTWGSHFATSGGYMVSFELESRDSVNRLFQRLSHIPFCSSLGDVWTTVSHPASTSHRTMTPQGRAELGIHEGLVRVSVGIEPWERIRDDFAQSLGTR